MSEKSNGPQLVGSADARDSKSPEAFQKEKFPFTPEQQQVADVTKESGEKFEKSVIEAREKAAGKLKELRGKELVDAGTRQMGHGVLETVKAQLIGVPVFGLLGGVVGGLFGKEIGGSMPSGFMEPLQVIGGEFVGSNSDFSRINEVLGYEAFPTSSVRSSSHAESSVPTVSGAVGGGLLGMKTGAFLGFEMAGIDYNKKVAEKEHLPKVSWYDWIASNIGVIAMRSVIKNNTARFVLTEALNPITVGGIFNIAKGYLQLGK